MIRWFFGNVLTHAKRPLFLYQRLLWYLGHFRNEAGKLLGLWSDVALLILVLRGVGIEIGVLDTILAFTVVIILGIIIGRILVLLGIPAYNQDMANSQNPQLEEILTRVRRIEEK